MALPGPLVGVSLVYLFNTPWLNKIGWLSLMPVLAHMARFLPIAVLILLAQLRRTDPQPFEAAKVFQSVGWRRVFQIGVPLFSPGLLACAGLIFAFSLGELGAILMVVPPGESTLTMRIYNYLHYGASDAVMGLSLLLWCCVMLAGSVVAGAISLGSRFVRARETSR